MFSATPTLPTLLLGLPGHHAKRLSVSGCFGVNDLVLDFFGPKVVGFLRPELWEKSINLALGNPNSEVVNSTEKMCFFNEEKTASILRRERFSEKKSTSKLTHENH